ncbi:Hsp20/alpha crystallin family protein [Saccharibacillus sp. JS10]|uniref:Hsp20/alpha crystallin family protein n=1 Tax=Saccharibacillus sp. JS10 TaxID=2950552 RepID=UPI00210E6A8F|nr:Hsp20 family protein [Saccharibacillus sp. JS10]MCQ4087067.1 Hsp20 family protein [Saccharibacillus sp. JS10]
MFEQGPFGRRAEEIFDQMAKTFGGTFGEDFASSIRDRVLSFRTDIYEYPDRYILEAELPGFDKDQIDIDYTASSLTIRAVRRDNQEGQEDRRVILNERRHGEFVRHFHLENANRDEIRASLKEGVLKLDIPKLQSSTSKRILIESED